MPFIDFDDYLEDKVYTIFDDEINLAYQIVNYSDVITLCEMYENKINELKDTEEVKVFNILDEFISQLDDNFLHNVEEETTERYSITISPIEAFDRWANSRHINLTLYKCWDKEALQQSELVETVKYLLKEIPIKMWCRGMEVNL